MKIHSGVILSFSRPPWLQFSQSPESLRGCYTRLAHLLTRSLTVGALLGREDGGAGGPPCHILCAVLLLAFVGTCGAQQAVTVTAPTATPYVRVSAGLDWTVWQSTNFELLPSGQIIPHVRRFEERATGLNFLNPATGNLEPAKEEIDLLPDGSGAAATNGQIQVYFPNDLATGVIRVITPAPESLVLESQPVSVGYSDSTNYIEIASITNSVGEIISSNEVLYPSALIGPGGLKCDVLYEYRKSGLEQNIIFRTQPPTPGDGANVRVQVTTLFFNSPTPSQTAEPVNPQAGLSDSCLSFGRSKMIQGRAFLAGDSDSAQIPTFKTWVNIDQTTHTSALIEQVPYNQVSASLATLPLVASAGTGQSHARYAGTSGRGSVERAKSGPLPHPPSSGSGAASGRASVAKAGNGSKISRTRTQLRQGYAGQARMIDQRLVTSSPTGLIGRKPGFCFDYIQITANETNFVFRGDEAYFVSSGYYLYGKTTIEGGTIVKMNNGGQLNIDPSGTVDCQTQPYKPAIFTSYNENDVGDWWGSGSPAMGDVKTFLNFNSTNVLLHDVNFAYAVNAVTQNTPGSISLWDCEFVDVATAVSAYNINLYNVLIGRNTITNAAVIVEGSSMLGENVTADYGSAFIQATNSGTTVALTNCLITSQQLLSTGSSSATLQTNAVVCQPTLTGMVYAPTGGGSYYLTNGSQFIGTPNIDPDLLGDLQEKTVWPPIVYADTNISSVTNLSPVVARDTNSSPMIGFHYSPLDAVFGGYSLTNSLTISPGTAVGFFEENGPVNVSGQPYAVALGNGANLVFDGNATEPCYLAQYAMVQERGNNNWNTYTGNMAPLTFNGNSSSQAPLVSGSFTKFIWNDSKGILNDNSAYGAGIFKNCEFYNLGMSSYGIQFLTFTNCLFVRPNFDFWGSTRALNFTNENCTYYNGGLALSRLSGQNAFWSIENTIFDGTLIAYNDYYNGVAGYTFSEFNAYNTNNLSWQTYGFPYGNWTQTNIFEKIDANDLETTNLGWTSGIFGDFYVPLGSPVLQAGSTNANLLGLYHFTSVTNDNPPIVEGTNKVNMGFAYVAVNTNGVPLSTPGDGIPDYLADTNGNGIDDPGETPWDIGFQSEPQSTNVAQGQNVTFSATVGGIGPFTYQWLQNSNPIAGATNLTYTIYVVSPTNDGNTYSIMASNLDGHAQSTNAILWVSTPVVLSGGPSDVTVASGGNAGFTVTNSSGNHLIYQWYTNSVPLINGGRIGGVTGSNLTISSVRPSDGNGYYVVVSNAFNSLQSRAAMLTVITNPVITGMSPNTNAIQSYDVTFTVSDSGEQTNQWYFSNIVYSVSPYLIPNATQPSYTQLVVQPTNDGEYYVEASNLAGSTNAGALLNVLVPPWITSQPTNTTVTQGQNATFSITAIGTTNLGYQWFMNGANSIAWATSSILTLTNVGGTNAGGYTCVITNIAGASTSAWAWLSVNIGGGTTNGWGTNSSPPAIGLTNWMVFPTNASPTQPAIFLYGNPISIRAAASSQYGYVTNVAFYYTGTNTGPSSFNLAGNAVPGPDGVFALAWTNALQGTNILEAVAQDYDGQVATSSVVYVIMAVAPGFNRAADTNLVWTEGMGSTNMVLTAVVTNDGQPYNSAIHYNWITNQSNIAIANPTSASTAVTFSTNNTFYSQASHRSMRMRQRGWFSARFEVSAEPER
ncbi:MAG TPA: immunoglobulin domain-containing protein [Verrucomicrobiae bacterium]|nr:immunoglobulin domain-containing protein [Verrucomicrobiae bacterium]